MAAATLFRNILALVDGTESGMRAAACAIELARSMRSRLVAIAVVDTDTLRMLMSARILVPEEVAEFESELGRTERRCLTFVEQMAQKAGIAVETVLREGICHSTVLAEQRAIKADLIVIGGFHQTLTKHNLISRERQIIIDEAPCSVLVVK